ncbi:protein PFC0760c-like [Hydra vulgaris]|uniref:Protein PFC0760c-like n=1 Tax=Hydra vulgaris TaxID=6087 RepID=A0ABM4CA85_HYDVU
MQIQNENHVKITESIDKINEVKEYKEKAQAQPLETAIESQLKTTLESIIMNENDSIKTNENKKVANGDNKQDSKKEDSVKNDKGDDDNSNDEYDSSNDVDSRDDNDSSGDDGSYDDDNDDDSSEEECEVPVEFLKMHHIERVDYNWRRFKNFDRLNCSNEDLKEFKTFKKLEWLQYEKANTKYEAIDEKVNLNKIVIPAGFQQMDSGEMYAYNIKEFQNFDKMTAERTERYRYTACRKAEWEQRKKEHSQFHTYHEKKQKERDLKKEAYHSKKLKLTPITEDQKLN